MVRKRTLPAILLLVAFVPPPTLATHTPCDGGFHIEHTSEDDASLDGIDFSHPNEGWAVGYDYASEEASNERAYIVRFDEGSYDVMSDLPPRRGSTVLHDVSALPSGSAFVAGSQKRRRWRAVVLRWDGNEWTRMATPQPGRGALLRGIVALAEDDVWAVGDYEVAGAVYRTLVLHYDGERWSRAPAPSPGHNYAGLKAVGASSSDDAWAVGWGRVGGEGGVVLRWDGSRWRRLALPKRLEDKRVDLDAVETVAPDDVWVVGRAPQSRRSLALALHWNGERWERRPMPDRRGHEWLFDVSVRGPDDVWAVGWRFVPEVSYPYAVHWDGSTWSPVHTDDPREFGEFSGLAADGRGALWASVEESDHGWVIERACGTPTETR